MKELGARVGVSVPLCLHLCRACAGRMGHVPDVPGGVRARCLIIFLFVDFPRHMYAHGKVRKSRHTRHVSVNSGTGAARLMAQRHKYGLHCHV